MKLRSTCLTGHVLNCALQVELPEVDVLHSLAQLAGDVILSRVGLCVRVVDQLLRFLASPKHLINYVAVYITD